LGGTDRRPGAARLEGHLGVVVAHLEPIAEKYAEEIEALYA
jgi:hypothetical protein